MVHLCSFTEKNFTYGVSRQKTSTLSEGLIWHDGGGWNVQRPRPVLDMTKMIPNDPRSLRSLMRLLMTLRRLQMTNNQGDIGDGRLGGGPHEFDEYYDISYHPNLENLGALNAY